MNREQQSIVGACGFLGFLGGTSLGWLFRPSVLGYQLSLSDLFKSAGENGNELRRSTITTVVVALVVGWIAGLILGYIICKLRFPKAVDQADQFAR